MAAEHMSDSSDFELASVLENHAEAQRLNRRRKVIGGVAVVGLLLCGAAAAIWHSAPAVGSTGELQPMVKEEMVVRPAYEKCSKEIENCMSTKCCKITGQKCFMKDAGYAQCKAACVPGQDGWCTEAVNTKPVASSPGLRFFCFVFYQENMGTTKPNYDLSLLRTQLKLGASIFGCPEWAVYSDVDTWLSPGPPALRTTKVNDVDGDFYTLRRKDTGEWQNAMMTYQAWLDIRSKKLAHADWVVKVDPDAVFLPGRLLDALNGYKVPAGGVYVENCRKVQFGFFGHLEVVSTEAFNTFLSNLESCKATLDWKGQDPNWKFGPYGEDLFMQKCMDKYGVSKVSDFNLSKNGKCPGDVPKDLLQSQPDLNVLKWKPDCATSNSVVLHPFKKPAEYFQCLAKTQQ